MTDDAKRRIEHGAQYPYDGERPEQDWAHRAARGIAADLCDRRGIKWEMGKVDDDSESDYSVRCDIVDSHAAIIRAALSGSAGEACAKCGLSYGDHFAPDGGGCAGYERPARADLEGWVMVPKDPTHQMCPSQGLRAAWAWALAAAPSPPRPAR